MSTEMIVAFSVFFVVVVIFLFMGGQIKSLSVGKLINAEFYKDKKFQTQFRVILDLPQHAVRQDIVLALDGRRVCELQVLEEKKTQDVQLLRVEKPGQYHYSASLKGVNRLYNSEYGVWEPVPYTASGQGLIAIQADKTYVLSSFTAYGGPQAGKHVVLKEFGKIDDSELPEDLELGELTILDAEARKENENK